MVSRTESIISKARELLGDQRKERWSDARLLSLLDEAQNDVAIHTRIFHGTCTLAIQDGAYEYELPDDILLLTRATFGNTPLPIVTYDSMDELAAKLRTYNYDKSILDLPRQFIDQPRVSWDDDHGSEIQALVFDNRDLSKIRVYPIPVDSSDITYTFENGGSTVFTGDELMGVVADITDYAFSNPFGVVVGLFDPDIDQEVMSSPFGIVTDIGESDNAVQLWYVRKPAEIKELNSNPELHPIFDKALQYYVAACAFDDDLDTRSEGKAARARAKYEVDLKSIMRVASASGVQSAKRETTYRGPFDA